MKAFIVKRSATFDHLSDGKHPGYRHRTACVVKGGVGGRELEPEIRRSQFFLSAAAEEAQPWAVNGVSSFGSWRAFILAGNNTSGRPLLAAAKMFSPYSV